MDVFLMIESSLCALYVTLTSPIVRLGNAWMDRLDRISKGEETEEIDAHDLLDACKTKREPTVSDITPVGYVKVLAMGPGGKWQVLHDYPIRLLPPNIKLVNDHGEDVR